MTDIAADARVRRDFTALAEAAQVVGSAQIRNRATLAGNICNASPAADTAPALLVYGAEVVATGSGGTRRIPIDDFFIGPGRTALAAGEIVTAIELPLPPRPAGRRPPPAHAPPRPRPRVGDAGLRGDRRRARPPGLRQRRAAAAPGHRRQRRAGRRRRRRPRRGTCCSTACWRRPAPRRGRCGPARRTAWRCCASWPSGPPTSRPGVSPAERPRDGHGPRSASPSTAGRGSWPWRRTTRCSTCCATTSG